MPANADYANLVLQIDATINSCKNVLMTPPKSPDCPVMLVKAASEPEGQLVAISALSFGGKREQLTFLTSRSLSGYMRETIPARQLDDRMNRDAYVRPAAKRIMARDGLSADATVVVLKGSRLNAASLIQQSQGSQFIVEQESLAKQFAANLDKLKRRVPSSQLTVFDFSPRSAEAMESLGLNKDELRDWRRMSERIEGSLKVTGDKRAAGIRTLAALEARMKDINGGVLILYGHSDGQQIFLDTDEGVKQLTAADISRLGDAAGNRLPPVILLNCKTRAVLGPAFLAAGSPFVGTSDVALPIVDIATFIDRLMQSVAKGTDVIDAFFDVQKVVNLAGVRGIAAAGSKTPHFLTVYDEFAALLTFKRITPAGMQG
jgi:hypothetical protein